MNIYLDTIGCRLNQSEIETFAREFRATGHQLVSSPKQADLAVINTCTVTAAAASDSRQKIRQVARSGDLSIVVTGCWSTMEPDMAASLPSVSTVIHNLDKDRLVSIVLQTEPTNEEIWQVERVPIPGSRKRTRAFIKVQDGCNNRCSYCITSIARGPSRSHSITRVMQDIRSAYRGGAKEIILTGVHLGTWGIDLTPGLQLNDLLEAIFDDAHTPRVRLSSLEPWDIQPSLLTLWRDYRLCRHLHLPLQSGCSRTLKRMGRKTNPTAFGNLLQNARTAIPDVAVTTDIIVGFPGETDDEFQESLDFVRSMQFAGGHVFTYSERPGTVAARLPGKVSHHIRKARNNFMQQVLAQTEATYQQGFLGQELNVLWETAKPLGDKEYELNGITDNYLRVRSHSKHQLSNRITPVRLIDIAQHTLIGMLI